MLLNCDMGESFGHYTIGDDQHVMPYIDMANIACGMHASDPDVMNASVELAKKHKVMIGAHPGYADLQGFGRRNFNLNPRECENLMIYQVGALGQFCKIHNVELSYIKPHGALYNTMMSDEKILRSALNVASKTAKKLMLLASSKWEYHKNLAKEFNCEIILEAFIDRAYESDGSLVNRNKINAKLSPEMMLQRLEDCCQKKAIRSIDGEELYFPIDSLCVHGDGEGIQLIKKFREIMNHYA